MTNRLETALTIGILIIITGTILQDKTIALTGSTALITSAILATWHHRKKEAAK